MKHTSIRNLSAISVLEGVVTVTWLALIPTEGRFFTPTRLALMLSVAAISMGWLFLYLRTDTASRAVQWVANWRGKKFLVGLSICLPLLILSAATHQDLWSQYLSEAVFIRAIPLLVWISLLSIQVGWFLVLIDVNEDAITRSLRLPRYQATLVLSSFLLIWLFISISRIGITSDRVGLSWGPPGTPITFGQVALVFAVSMSIMVPIWLLAAKYTELHRLEVIFFTGLWLLAVFLWTRETMIPSHFASAPMQPNFEYYPNSDAAVFDRSAFQLLFGANFQDRLIRRPLYVGLLAMLHRISGPGYDGTVILQILVLAFIPALNYLLTTKLSNRLAGLLAGGLIVLRETNAIHLSGEIPTSHAKLLMSDLLTMLCITVILYVCVAFIKGRNRDHWSFALLGACAGLTALVRAQAMIILVPIILFILLSQRPFKTGLTKSLVVFLGLGLVLLPWLLRNWNLTGELLLDDRTELRLLARNYSSNPTSFPIRASYESEEEYSSRMSREIIGYISTFPKDVLFFISNHFLHNLVSSALYLAPIYSDDSPVTLLQRVPYWDNWDGKLTMANRTFLLVNLFILGLGIAVAHRDHKLAGLLPLAIFGFYNAGNALARSSGWRFVLPVDWIILMYFCIGLAYLPSGIERMTQKKDGAEEKPQPRSHLMAGAFVLLLLIGASVSIAEQLIPNRNFSNLTSQTKELVTQQGSLSQDALDSFLQQEDAVIVSGIALYPRYFQPNTRFSLIGMPENFSYLHFWLIGDPGGQLVLPLQNVPDDVPHTEEVTILGCRTANYISAWAVITHSASGRILARDPVSPLSCPLDEPN
jgi:hypothetical protein